MIKLFCGTGGSLSLCVCSARPSLFFGRRSLSTSSSAPQSLDSGLQLPSAPLVVSGAATLLATESMEPARGGGDVSLVLVRDPPPPPPCPPGPLSCQGSTATGHTATGQTASPGPPPPGRPSQPPPPPHRPFLNPPLQCPPPSNAPPPLGAFGPLLLGGGVASKSEETSPRGNLGLWSLQRLVQSLLLLPQGLPQCQMVRRCVQNLRVRRR